MSTVELLEKHGLSYKSEKYFDEDTIAPSLLTEKFLEDLKFALANQGPVDKEFYNSEFIIVPFLREAWQRHEKLNLFSHPNVRVDSMNLYPDYLVTGKHKTGLKVVTRPLLLTVKAKDERVQEGWADAFAQLIAARLVNETEEIPIQAIVTTGDLWYFGKLDGKWFIRHPIGLSLEDPQKLMGVLNYLFDECEKYAEVELAA